MADKVYSDAEIISAIKRLNDRIKQFHKQGLTESAQYYTLLGSKEMDEDIISEGVLLNMPMAKARKNSKRTYPQLMSSVNAYTPEQIKEIMKFGKIGARTTAGVAKANVIETLKARGIKEPTKAQIKKQLKLNRRIHDFIVTHSEDIYKVQYLANAVWKSEKLTEQEAEDLLNMYNNPDYIAENGDFAGDNNFTTYHKEGTPQ